MSTKIEKIETRTITTAGRLEFRSATPTQPAILTGYAALYNRDSAVLAVRSDGLGFVEEIRPGAFRSTLASGKDIRALFEHDSKALLGRTSSGTLRLREDSTGLYFELALPDTQASRDMQELVRRGDINGTSFGFVARRDDWNWDVKPPRRTLLDVDLHEITITATPAYPATSGRISLGQGMGTRAIMAQAIQRQRDAEMLTLETKQRLAEIASR